MIDDTVRGDAVAKKRFMAIQLVRFMGFGLVILGLVIIKGVIDLPGIVGFALVVVGLFDAFFMPTVLAKRWKSPTE